MKINKKYILFINPVLKMAYYGTEKFNTRISKATLGYIYDCSFSQLKNNLKILIKNGYIASQRKW